MGECMWRGCSSHTQRAPHLRPHGLVWGHLWERRCHPLPALTFVGKLKLYLSNSFRTSQTESEGSQRQWVDWSGFNIPPFLLYPCVTVRDTTFWLSLDRSLSVSKGYVKIKHISEGRMEEAGVREADIHTDYSRRFGGRRWGRPACWTSDECTKRIDRWMEATTASPTAVQVEWRHFHTNLALKYWAVKKTVTRDTT